MSKCIFIILATLFSFAAHAQSNQLDSLFRDARKRQDTAMAIRYFIEKNDRFGVDTSGPGKMSTNNFIYSYIFKHSNEKKQLKKAAKYMKVLLADELPGEFGNSFYSGWMDTYANVLYKLGKRRKAIQYSEEAVRRDSLNAESAGNLAKMKAGQSTW